MELGARPRILIARLSAVGDAILTLPVAVALRRRFPDAMLSWVVEERARQVVAGHPCLDKVVVLPRGWFTSPRGVWLARQQLRVVAPEVSIDCQGMTKSALACRLSGAGIRIGLGPPHGRELSRLWNTHLVRPSRPHLTDRSLALLSPLGVSAPAVEWRYPLRDAAVKRVDRWLHGERLERFLLINPGATWDSKRWETDRFAAVARHLSGVLGLRSVIAWGSAVEQEWARQIAAQAPRASLLAPPTDLPELAALTARAALFLSGDTGPLHLSVAVGTPTVGLYGPTRPADCGPYGPPHVALQAAYQEGSRRSRRQSENWALRRISSQQVAAACEQLLLKTEATKATKTLAVLVMQKGTSPRATGGGPPKRCQSPRH